MRSTAHYTIGPSSPFQNPNLFVPFRSIAPPSHQFRTLYTIYQHARSPSIPHEQQLYCCKKCLKSLYLSHSRDRKYNLRAARGHLYVLSLPPDILIHIACLSVVHTVILVFYKLRETILYTPFSFQPAGSYLFICKQYSVALVELSGA